MCRYLEGLLFRRVAFLTIDSYGMEELFPHHRVLFRHETEVSSWLSRYDWNFPMSWGEFFIVRRGGYSRYHDVIDTFLRRGHAIIRDMDFSSFDDTTWLTLSHVVVTIHCISFQSFAPYFRSRCSLFYFMAHSEATVPVSSPPTKFIEQLLATPFDLVTTTP